MFRLNYTNLNKNQVEDILAKSAAPTCASEFCSRLTGKSLKIVLDQQPVQGSVLEYEFETDTKLIIKENSAAAAECDYGALSLGNVTLFSHMIPGTKRGYSIIINWKTAVVTAFEMWFIDYERQVISDSKVYYEKMEANKLEPYVNREVQRQYYFGYCELEGKTPPEQRDKLSLRLENTMIEWCEDRGKHRLSTYTSTSFTTHVELDTPDGGDVLTFTSDILQISDSLFICSFGEVEYSGRLSVEVLDLFSMKKIGVTMGIDEKDAFEHNLYKGHGRFRGRYSTFYDFNDRGNQYSDFIKSRYDLSLKGARMAYRTSILRKKVTKEDITAAAKNPLIFDKDSARNRTMASSFALDDSDYCVGKNITFRGDDGLAVEIRFNTITELEYRMPEESEWHAEQYRGAELDEELIVLGFYCSGSNPPANYIFALDFKNGCATCITSKMGSKHALHDLEPGYHFGVIETEGLAPQRVFRHGFTDELLGRAFTQTYSDEMSSIHIYNAPHSYSWTIINNAAPGTPANRAGGAIWSSPCEYLKLRNDVYALIWVEQKWSGHMDTLFRNLRTARDTGFAFGLSYDGNTVYMDKMGGISRVAGHIDIADLYPLRNYNPMS